MTYKRILEQTDPKKSTIRDMWVWHNPKDENFENKIFISVYLKKGKITRMIDDRPLSHVTPEWVKMYVDLIRHYEPSFAKEEEK